MHLKFRLYSEEELEKKAILITKKKELVDNTTSYTLTPKLPCKQCKKIIECPGHLGRISLHELIVHPLFVNLLCKELTHICPICKKYDDSLNVKSICCKKRIVSTTFSLHRIQSNNSKNVFKKQKSKKANNNNQVYAFSFGNKLLSIEDMYNEICISNFDKNPKLKSKLLKVFIKSIPILPLNLRPSIVDSNNITIHNNITSMYISFLDLNQHYYNYKNGSINSNYSQIVYNLYKKILGITSSTDKKNDNKIFIKQLLSGKKGIFRNMCLAKRQNFCLRSVIVPNIDTPLDRILLPKVFTDELVPYGYKPNDYVIINRQPTLQSTSILAVRSYPSNSLTIQINPLIANVFQADFDGDEMNIFWLPGEEAKQELKTKLNIINNIRSFNNASLMIKFIQDTLTGLYNMTRDQNIVDPIFIERICKKLNISNKKWASFLKFYKSRMGKIDIPYSHILSILLPKTLTLEYDGQLIIDRGILLGVINGKNQTILLKTIIYYGNSFYLKFMWDVQRLIHEYNLLHTITISIGDCIANDDLKASYIEILNNVPDFINEITVSNLDSLIVNQNNTLNQMDMKNNILLNYYSLIKLTDSINNNLTNIVNSGSKGNKDNIIQILMSVGIQAALPNSYIKGSYSEGLSSKELFIHSKSGRAGIISTSLNTSSTGYLQRELVKSLEDLVTDENGFVHDYNNNEIYYYPFASNTSDIDDSFLEYAFSMSCD